MDELERHWLDRMRAKREREEAPTPEPPQKPEKQTYRAVIEWLDTKTGKTGTYIEKPMSHGSLWDDHEYGISDFQWSDGNYACDCNRGLFFIGQDWEDIECGNERFIILKMTALTQDGEPVEGFIYRDGAADEAVSKLQQS